ncbi:hypothetical protein EAY18_18590 [Vibrio anguillarum]|nr:hypothetical protein [Vibrio anguillarum]
MFWLHIYHCSCLGWFLNHSTIAIVAFGRVKSFILLNFHNKRFKRDCQRVAVFVQIGFCDYGCYFRFSV